MNIRKHLYELFRSKVDLVDLSYFMEGLEDKMPHLVKQYKKWNGDWQVLSDDVIMGYIRDINRFDPTGDKATYTAWLIVQSAKDKGSLADSVRQNLRVFDEIKKVKDLGMEKDINKYETTDDLDLTLKTFGEVKSKRQIEKEKEEGSELIYNQAGVKVIEIKTPEASHAILYGFGKDSPAKNWCVKDINYATDYLRKGPLYLFLQDDEPWLMGSPSADMLNDNSDREISLDTYEEVKPVLDKLKLQFTDLEDKFTKEFYRHNPCEMPDDYTWDEDLDMSEQEKLYFPNRLTVNGDVDCRQSKGDLPDDLNVTGTLDISHTYISIPDNFHIEGDLDADGWLGDSFPANFKCKNLFLLHSEISSIGEGLDIEENCDLSSCSNLEELPGNMTVGGDLILTDTNVFELPSDLHVGGKILPEDREFTREDDNWRTREVKAKHRKEFEKGGQQELPFEGKPLDIKTKKARKPAKKK